MERLLLKFLSRLVEFLGTVLVAFCFFFVIVVSFRFHLIFVKATNYISHITSVITLQQPNFLFGGDKGIWRYPLSALVLSFVGKLKTAKDKFLSAQVAASASSAGKV